MLVRDDKGKVIGCFERHEMHWDFSDPGNPVAVPKLEAGYQDKTSGAQGVKTLCAADFMCF